MPENPDTLLQTSGRICVSIAADPAAGNPVNAALATAGRSEPAADVLEIRLDSLPTPDIRPFMQQLHKPLLFTNRPLWEGGAFAGGEDERLAPLLAAIRAGAAYVDIEINTSQLLRDQLLDVIMEGSATRLIISWHNFIETPAVGELEAILLELHQSGAHVGKLVTMAHDFKDVLRVLNLQARAAELAFPLIAFCMGSQGTISRLATLALGGYMTYAAPDTGGATAFGQLPVSVLRQMLAELLNKQPAAPE